LRALARGTASAVCAEPHGGRTELQPVRTDGGHPERASHRRTGGCPKTTSGLDPDGVALANLTGVVAKEATTPVIQAVVVDHVWSVGVGQHLPHCLPISLPCGIVRVRRICTTSALVRHRQQPHPPPAFTSQLIFSARNVEFSAEKLNFSARSWHDLTWKLLICNWENNFTNLQTERSQWGTVNDK